MKAALVGKMQTKLKTRSHSVCYSLNTAASKHSREIRKSPQCTTGQEDKKKQTPDRSSDDRYTLISYNKNTSCTANADERKHF